MQTLPTYISKILLKHGMAVREALRKLRKTDEPQIIYENGKEKITIVPLYKQF